MNDQKITVSGTVYWYGTKERVRGAVVKATHEEEVQFTRTDDDGDFSLEVEAGTWTLVALHEDGRASKPQTQALEQDKTDFEFNLFRHMGTADAAAGLRFFVALGIALGVLAIVYVALHLFGHREPSFFWGTEPWRLAEVLLWALAGILVNLIIISGSYLRWGHFYREGIIMHIAQLVTVPLLAVVFVLILSLATLQVNLTEGNQLDLDLSDPRLLVAVAFLIGSRPWGLWGFLRETARKITEP